MGWDWHKFRKDTAFATRNLVWYTLIMSVVTEMVSAMVSALTKTGGSSESLISEVTGTAASAGMIAGVLIGVFCLFKIDGRKDRYFPKIETKADSRRIFKILHLHDHGSDGLFVDRSSSGTDFESVGAFDGYADRACFGRF